MNPRVSVVMITHNHEKFIKDAIESVLAQTWSDFELIVVNDGSTDHTREIVDSFADSRIRRIHQKQSGPSLALDRGIADCRTEMIALMSGDDLSEPERLAVQMRAYNERRSKVLFSHVSFIDDKGAPIPPPAWLGDSFNVKQLTQAQIARNLFLQGNFLNAVTLLASSDALKEVIVDGARGSHHPGLLQLQDFDLWLRLIARYPFEIIQQPLVRYRIRTNHENLSSPDPKKDPRVRSEYFLATRGFLSRLPENLFRTAFDRDLRRSDFQGALERECEEAFICMDSTLAAVRIQGIEQLGELLEQQDGAEVLRKKYNYTALDFSSDLLLRPVFHNPEARASALHLQGTSLFASFVPSEGRFRLAYDVSRFPESRNFKWEPLKGAPCRVRINAISFKKTDGSYGEVPISSLETNGRRVDGIFQFRTLDPEIGFAINEAIQFVVIEGEITLEQPRLSHQGRRLARRIASKLARTLRLYSFCGLFLA